MKAGLIPIEEFATGSTEISKYWTGHTVRYDYFTSAKDSLDYRKNVFEMYPKYREFADMDRQHDGEVILDYGCGPGNDLTWYTQMSNPKMVIGMDVSTTSLERAQFRMALHGVSSEQCRLIKIDESAGKIPLEDESIDFVSCQGVLMHTSKPEAILKEFCRVLKKMATSRPLLSLWCTTKSPYGGICTQHITSDLWIVRHWHHIPQNKYFICPSRKYFAGRRMGQNAPWLDAIHRRNSSRCARWQAFREWNIKAATPIRWRLIWQENILEWRFRRNDWKMSIRCFWRKFNSIAQAFRLLTAWIAVSGVCIGFGFSERGWKRLCTTYCI